MSFINGRDFLYLIWHDINTKKQYIVGTLSKNGKFEFEYNNEIDEALENGFLLLTAFPEKKRYVSDVLFPAFSSRLPDRKRIDIENILKKYELEEYDSYELLKRSGARLPIDNLEFIDPIFDNDEKVERKFYIAGSKYYMGCNEGNDCVKNFEISLGENIQLECEPDNKKDKNAVKMLYKNNIIGYVPRYYAESISNIIKNKKGYICTVIETNYDFDCRNCIRVKFSI